MCISWDVWLVERRMAWNDLESLKPSKSQRLNNSRLQVLLTMCFWTRVTTEPYGIHVIEKQTQGFTHTHTHAHKHNVRTLKISE